MSFVWAVISFVNNLFSGVKAVLQAIAEWRAMQREVAKQGRDKAVDDATKATTPGEAYDAQDRIVSNDP